MRLLRLLVLAVVCFSAAPAFAVEPDEMLKNPVLEARARALSQEIRCMVCQNQTIDESAAPLAHDLRVLVRERLKKGDSDQQVLDFLVRRYGEFVLLKPPFNWHTALLWLLSPLALLIAALSLWPLWRRARENPPVSSLPLTTAEEERLRQLMSPDQNPSPAGARTSTS